MTLDEVLEDITAINDDTYITLIINKRQIRGKWYEDHILRHCDREVEFFSVHVSQNSVTIILK